MAEDLILKATLDTSEVESEAKRMASSLAKTDGVSANTGKAFATNMNSARMASDAMFRSIQAMGGPLGRLVGQLKAFTDSARMLSASGNGTYGNGTAGSGRGYRSDALNAATNLAGGAAAGGALSRSQQLVRRMHAKAQIEHAQLRAGEAWYGILNKEQAAFPPEHRFSAQELSIQAANRVASGATPPGSTSKDLIAAELAKSTNKVAKASLFTEIKLMSFAGKLAYATAAVGAFAAGFEVGGWIYDKLTGRKQEQAVAEQIGAYAGSQEQNNFTRAMELADTPEAKRAIIEQRKAKVSAGFAAYDAFMAGSTYNPDPLGPGANPKFRQQAKDLEASSAKMLVGMGAKSKSGEDLSAFNIAGRTEMTMLNQLLTDISVKNSKKGKGAGFTTITDDLTRIGGSIGGGIDYQKSMVDSLKDINESTKVLRTWRSKGMGMPQTVYI